MTEVTFYVNGKPTGKARPRFTKSGHTYTPAATKTYEAQVAKAYREAAGDLYFHAPIFVRIEANYAIPKTWSKAKQEEAYKLTPGKPDADNIAKIILDALNGVAYDDDVEVTRLLVTRRYTPGPAHVTVMIMVGS